MEPKKEVDVCDLLVVKTIAVLTAVLALIAVIH